MTIAARASQLSKTYGSGSTQVVALDSVDFEIRQGEFTAIMGPSGSGKSTLMHVIAALDTPTEGQVFLGETDVAGLSDNALTQLRRERVGFIFQAFNLVPALTAEENIVLPLSIAGKKVDREWFDRVVDVLGLRDRLSHKPAELSGGQQQRVACARAMINRPEIIFGDEPTGNLDSTSAAEVLTFLRRSVDEFDQTVVMVTHDAGAASYADRAVFLKDGAIIHEMHGATQEELLAEMARMYPRPDEHEISTSEIESSTADATTEEPEVIQDAAEEDAETEVLETVDAEEPAAEDDEESEAGDESVEEAETAPSEETVSDDDADPDPAEADFEPDEFDEYGEEVPSLYRDGGTAPQHSSGEFPESEAEISAPRRAIQD